MRRFFAFALTLGLGVFAAVIWLGPVWNFADLFRQFWAPFTLAAIAAAGLVAVFGQGRQRWASPIFALLIALPGLPETFRGQSEAGASAAAGTPLTVITHNVWGRNTSVEALAESLADLDADVVALQEVWGNAWPLPRLVEEAYPNQADCDRYAVALVTRLDITASGCLDWWWWRSQDGEADTPFFHAPPGAWATVRLADGSELTVASVHMTWPNPLRDQNVQREGLALMLRAFPRDRLVVMGDFNSAAPSSALARIEYDLGLDRVTHGIATWPSQSMWEGYAAGAAPVPTMMAGIDHIFLGGAVSAAHIERLPDTGSDHRGLRAMLVVDEAESPG